MNRGTIGVVALVAALTACGDGSRGGFRENAGIVPDTEALTDVEPAPAEIFFREPAGTDSSRVTLHILVPGDATRAAVRQMLYEELVAAGRQDTGLVALRAIVYVGVHSQPDEGSLSPVAWAEWLPPEGWAGATAESRDRHYRVYTYFDAPPPW